MYNHSCFCLNSAEFISLHIFTRISYQMNRGVSSILNIPRNARILRSLSLDPFYNLALEEWLFQNIEFSTSPLVLFWQNSPSVVIGRYQNPWKEANINFLRGKSISLVRRNSGGGTVYHDTGNCNISIFSTRAGYNRRRNLLKVCEVLNDSFSLVCEVTNKLDIVYNGSKVSGTAARIVRDKAYHHFTILLSSNLGTLSRALQSPIRGVISTNATPSIPSPVVNLSSLNEQLTADSFYSAYSNNIIGEIEGELGCSIEIPAGVRQIVLNSNEFSSWNSVFGKTPKFCISPNPNIELVIEKGRVSTVEGTSTNIFKSLIGSKLTCKDFMPKFNAINSNCSVQEVTEGFDALIQNLP